MIKIFSYNDFNEYCNSLGVNDINVETDFSDYAFISIIGTDDCMKYYIEEPDAKHYFSTNHSNVINLEFDDLPRDITWNGHLFKAMSDDDSKKLFEFIERNIGKKFIIHCWAGQSRSAAVGKFINVFYGDRYNDKYDIPDTPNIHVYTNLTRKYYNKYGLFGQKEES